MAAMNMDLKKFEELSNQDKPLLVDYWAPWCGYCRRIGPAYDKVAESWGGEINVAKVNIDDEGALPKRQSPWLHRRSGVQGHDR